MRIKKVLAITGTVVGVGIVGAGLFLFGKGDSKDDVKWLKSLSLEQLNKIREKVRIAFCEAGKDYKLASKLQSLLSLIDKIIYDKHLTIGLPSFLSGVPKSTIADIASGKISPRLDTLEQLAKGAKCSNY